MDNKPSVAFCEISWQKQQVTKRRRLNSLLYDSPAFDDVKASMLDHLETVPGAWALDLGCGEGKDLLSLAKRGMRVVGADLSWAQLCLAKERISRECPTAKIMLVQADAAASPFPSETFYLVFGKAVLHHLVSLDVVLREIARILCSGGYVSFAEPLSYHPLFWLGRRLTPHMRSVNEHPFQPGTFGRLAAFFEKCEVEFWFLLTPLSYILRLLPGGEPLFRKLYACLSRLDKWLFYWIPFMRNWAWYGVIRGRKGS